MAKTNDDLSLEYILNVLDGVEKQYYFIFQMGELDGKETKKVTPHVFILDVITLTYLSFSSFVADFIGWGLQQMKLKLRWAIMDISIHAHARG